MPKQAISQHRLEAFAQRLFPVNLTALGWENVVKPFDVFGNFAKTVQAAERVKVELRVGAIIYYVFPASTFFRPLSDFEKRVVALQIEDKQADFLRFVIRILADDIAQKHIERSCLPATRAADKYRVFAKRVFGKLQLSRTRFDCRNYFIFHGRKCLLLTKFTLKDTWHSAILQGLRPYVRAWGLSPGSPKLRRP